jgi:TRAP-type C4-dicarboxylate transport system permease small subunit
MADAMRKPPPAWLQAADQIVRKAIMWVSCTLLVLMVLFTIYTIVMRYVFKDPPFWGDTVSLFCNIWLVLIAYSLAVRDRQDIATEGIYAYLPPRVVTTLRSTWHALTFLLGAYLIWYGMDAALNVPGKFWELGGLPKMVPMLSLPLSGVLIAYATGMNVAEDLFGWQSSADREAARREASGHTI